MITRIDVELAENTVERWQNAHLEPSVALLCDLGQLPEEARNYGRRDRPRG